jgi:hypothetical protein
MKSSNVEFGPAYIFEVFFVWLPQVFGTPTFAISYSNTKTQGFLLLVEENSLLVEENSFSSEKREESIT